MSEDPVLDIYAPVISELRAQIEEYQRTIEMLELLRSKGIRPIAMNAGRPSAPMPSNGATPFANDAFFGMTIADAAKKYLAGTKKTAPARVIADALIAGGFKTSAKNFVENVRSIISRNGGIVFVNGEYGLAEWYPGRKGVSKKSTTPTPSESEPNQEETEDGADVQPGLEMQSLDPDK
jgi:hypothetical protein